ncbi:MAG: PTS sugar transporter subunit IIA [Thermoanaerobaculum sp.]|nr:PTS sugar transporter subunit IIA [Thermoanaerobaculum sp.]MDW7967229.1 PTS sugar transporter subunit IIA [Thermoanaerobaculum sp.]
MASFVPEPEDPKLSEIFNPGHVVENLTAATRDEVIKEIVSFVANKGMVTDPRWLETALTERERMVPTAMPNGVAFLHARHRAVDKFPRQFLLLARSAKGVAFGSPDDKPTHIFFLLAFRRDQAHLRWLARLSWMCRRRSFVSSLLRANNAEEMSRQLELVVEELPGNLRIRS